MATCNSSIFFSSLYVTYNRKHCKNVYIRILVNCEDKTKQNVGTT